MATMPEKLGVSGIQIIEKQEDRFVLQNTYEFRLKYNDVAAFLIRRDYKGGRNSEIVVAMSDNDDFLALEKVFLERYPDEKHKLRTEYAFRHGPRSFRRVIEANSADLDRGR